MSVSEKVCFGALEINSAAYVTWLDGAQTHTGPQQQGTSFGL